VRRDHRAPGLGSVPVPAGYQDDAQEQGAHILPRYRDGGTDVNVGAEPVQRLWHETRCHRYES